MKKKSERFKIYINTNSFSTRNNDYGQDHNKRIFVNQ